MRKYVGLESIDAKCINRGEIKSFKSLRLKILEESL